MTDEQCEKLFQQLIEILKRHQLFELTNRIADQIAENKIETTKVQTYGELPKASLNGLFPPEDPLHTYLKPASKADFSAIVPYTPKERLGILIDIIEHSIITTMAVETYVRQYFLEKQNFQEIVFRSQSGEKMKRINDNDSQTFQSHQNSIQHLGAVLDKVRRLL